MTHRLSSCLAFLAAALAVVSIHSSAGARPASLGVAAPSYYQRALRSYESGDYSTALKQLDRAAARGGADAKTRADLLNLRGAIYLRQARVEKAKAKFAEAADLNPALWDARFNLAEITRRQKRGAESQKAAAVASRTLAQNGLQSSVRPDEQEIVVAHRVSQFSEPSARVAMVQIVPSQRRLESAVAVRPGAGTSRRPPAPSANPVISSQDAPPAPALAPAGEEETDDIAPGLLARKRPAPKPSPSPNPSPSPAAPAETPPAAVPSGSPAASATPAPAATPSPDPATPAFLQRYESAYIKFLEKDFAGAKALLNEADAIQANQPASIDLRNKIFSYYYKIAYGKYSDKDYTGAQTALDDADAVQKDQPDSLNLRGLIFSRQRVFDQAEVMFKKAVAADPAFWAAKFNMAELPFTYKNYTVARSRYEQLLTETDASKQPREAELTQFKVFLTLLLEGKESAARAFMDHFSFTGSTPARYYCQAALEFYAGSTDKASESIAEARKEFPAQIEAIFADSFYRVGWLTDLGKGATAAAVASASPAEAPEPQVSPSPAAITASSPATNPDRLAAAKPTPMIVAIASPSPTPLPPVATSAPKATVTPAATATPSPSPTPSPKPTATVTPVPTATPSPKPTAIATATPTPTLAPKPTATPAPAPSPTAAATPAPTATPTIVPTATPTITPTTVPAIIISPTPTLEPTRTPEPTPPPETASPLPSEPPADASPAAAEEAEHSPQEDLIRLIAMAFVPLYLIGSWFYVIRRALALKAERRRPALRYSGRKRPPGDAGKLG